MVTSRRVTTGWGCRFWTFVGRRASMLGVVRLTWVVAAQVQGAAAPRIRSVGEAVFVSGGIGSAEQDQAPC